VEFACPPAYSVPPHCELAARTDFLDAGLTLAEKARERRACASAREKHIRPGPQRHVRPFGSA